MKTCTRCRQTKDHSQFNRHKGRADGFNNICKTCKKAVYHQNAEREKATRRKRYKNNRNKELANNKAWRQNNPNGAAVASKNWRENNPDKNRKSKRNWLGNNLDKNAASAAKYHAAKKNRTPPWLKEDHLIEIQKFYTEAAELSTQKGIKYSVDHIVPLQGETVSGLHVPWNLQVIPMTDNSRKGNRL